MFRRTFIRLAKDVEKQAAKEAAADTVFFKIFKLKFQKFSTNDL